MLQFLSFALFTVVGAISIVAIVVTVKEEMPFILRALGIDPFPLPPPPTPPEKRITVVRRQPAN